jgi:transposase
MTTKHKSEDLKLNAVEYYLVGDKSQVETCKIFKCSPRSLLRWVEKYKEEGEIKRDNRKPIAYKVHKEHVKFLIDELKKNKTVTMNELVIKLTEKFNIELSRFHINRIINDNNITLKITRIRHEPIKRFGKDININDKLKEFYQEIKKYKIEDIICIDETSISGLQKRQHCYSELGKRCIIKTTSQEVFKKYTGIFAISNEGILG